MARKLEHFIINFPKLILKNVFGVQYDSKNSEYSISEKVGCFFGVIGIFSLIYFIAFFGFDIMSKYPILTKISGYVIAFPIALYIWTHIANFIFTIFNFLTNKKPFAGIGLLIAILDGII